MKIENAIILAAGRGSRLGHLTDDKPKCMMKINNKSIIQRTIEMFKYKNINSIIVITGYKSDVLRKHLNDVDKGIKIIQNRIWENSNSITSMKNALNYFKNSIVIDSDIYINNPDCIRNEIDYSGYSAIKTIRPSEWQLITDKDGFIKKTEKSGQYDDGLPIIDISYWLEKDSIIIADDIMKTIQHTSIDNHSKFWDEIPLIDFLHEFKLKRYDINETDAMEFDTSEELDKVRKSVCSVD